MKLRNLSGLKFGRLTVISFLRIDPNRGATWDCVCDCGNHVEANRDSLVSGRRKSCYCLRSEHGRWRGKSNIRHGLTNSRTYASWHQMRIRCSAKKGIHFKNYRERGIRICARWNVFENFLADMGERPAGKTLDRINNNGNYEPSNCRWATPTEQERNTRANRIIEHNGKKLCAAEWSEVAGISQGTICRRLDNGWTTEQTLTIPPNAQNRIRPLVRP